jgi:hypothetical protein
MRYRVSIAYMLAIALVGVAASSALAEGWDGGPGGAEPSTVWDTDEVMWPGPNQAEADKIYFNGWLDYAWSDAFIPQPDGGAVYHGAAWSATGILGYWRDCNNDGYIGNKLAPSQYGSWSSYPADDPTTTVDESICPTGTPYNPGEDEPWIHEFLHIGPYADKPEDTSRYTDDDIVATCTTPPSEEEIVDRLPDPAGDGEALACENAVLDQFGPRRNTHFVNDTQARVWFDIGYPGGEPPTVRNVFERGYTWDLHGTLNHTDFTAGQNPSTLVDEHLGDGTWPVVPNFGECDWERSAGEGDTDGAEDGYGREFGGGPGGTCGLYPLWQVKRLYNDSDYADDRATPLVTVYGEGDCDANDVTVDVDGEPETLLYYRNIDPAVSDDPLMKGSVQGTIVNVREGTDNYDEGEDECENQYSGAGVTYENLETGGGERTVKDQVESQMSFFSGYAPAHTRAGEAAGADNAPVDVFNVNRGPFWHSTFSYISTPPGTLGTNAFTLGITYYAFVSQQAFWNAPTALASPAASLPNGEEAHVYGAEHCAVIGEGADESESGWHCDPTIWE